MCPPGVVYFKKDGGKKREKNVADTGVVGGRRGEGGGRERRERTCVSAMVTRCFQQ